MKLINILSSLALIAYVSAGGGAVVKGGIEGTSNLGSLKGVSTASSNQADEAINLKPKTGEEQEILNKLKETIKKLDSSTTEKEKNNELTKMKNYIDDIHGIRNKNLIVLKQKEDALWRERLYSMEKHIVYLEKYKENMSRKSYKKQS